MFFFKRKEIVVDCFTYIEPVYLNFPIDKAIKFYPDEFKKLRPTAQENTIKLCRGVNDLYTSGFILPAWDTFTLTMIDDGKFLADANAKNVNTGYHSRDQYGSIYPNSGHIKLYSPWLIKEKTGVKFLWMQPGWNRTDNSEKLNIVPAVVDFKYQYLSHISMFIKKGTTVKYNIGDPLVHVIPLSENNIKIKTHLLEQEVWTKEFYAFENFQRYDNHRNLKYPKFLETKKCPFGFGVK
jgi:hypothetical protein